MRARQTKRKAELDSIAGVGPRVLKYMTWLSKVQGGERESSRKRSEDMKKIDVRRTRGDTSVAP
jgi:hypothetical protein